VTLTIEQPAVSDSPADCRLGTGVYRGMPSEAYHALPHASNHRLGGLAQSPAHCRYRILNPEDPTPAMVMGTAAHDLILEEVSRVVVSGQCSAVLGQGKGRCKNNGKHLKYGEWYCGVKGHWLLDGPGDERGKSVLTRGEHNVVCSMAEEVDEHRTASKLLGARTDTELVCIWKDKASGVLVKLRADGVIAPESCCLDLKTIADDASPKAFRREIMRRGYHRQAALYLDGLTACGIDCTTFAFIVVEKAPPYGVATYELNYEDEVLASAREENAKLLEVWASCEESGKWPCYSPYLERIAVPGWPYHRFEGD
jgi:PDDEXK-like domain of unknown function (DUF3799)